MFLNLDFNRTFSDLWTSPWLELNSKPQHIRQIVKEGIHFFSSLSLLSGLTSAWGFELVLDTDAAIFLREQPLLSVLDRWSPSGKEPSSAYVNLEGHHHCVLIIPLTYLKIKRK